MAAKKAQPGTAVANIEAEIQRQAALVGQTVSGGGGNKITIDGKTFTMNGQTTSEPINVVILDHTRRNTWYGGVPYKRGVISPVMCFATSEPASLGGKVDNLIPVAESPSVQSEGGCNACLFDAFGSSATGEGKECKNTQRLVVILPDENPEESPLMIVDVSSTALKGYAAYVKLLSTDGKLPLSVVTQLAFNPSMTYGSLIFKAIGPNTNRNAHYARVVEAQMMLKQLPDLTGGEATAQPAKRAAAPRSKAKARRSA